MESVDKAKYLGVTISDDLKWESHINNICGKANKTLGFLRRILNIGSTSVKERVYKSLVRPSLEYACSVWDPHLNSDINKIEMVQQRAARYVTNRQHNTSSVGDMLHLEWRSLEDRRRDARLVMMYNISHDKVAVSKSDRFSPPLRHSRNMHSRSYQVSLCRTQQRKASFSPRTTVDWNRLPQTAVPIVHCCFSTGQNEITF